MAGQYIGVSGVARKVKNQYIGVAGVARKIKKGYIGVSSVARIFFSGLYDFVFEHGGSVSEYYTGWYNGNQVRLYLVPSGTDSAYADFRISGETSFAGKTITITYESSTSKTFSEIRFFRTTSSDPYDKQRLISGSVSGTKTVTYTIPSGANAAYFLISLSNYGYTSSTVAREIIITSLKIDDIEIL